MSKLQYIRLNCNLYIHSLQNIHQSRCMGFRFILPRFNVIFDIYCGCNFNIHIGVQTYAKFELTSILRRMRERLHQAKTWRPSGCLFLVSCPRYTWSQKSLIHQSSRQRKILVSLTRRMGTDMKAFTSVATMLLIGAASLSSFAGYGSANLHKFARRYICQNCNRNMYVSKVTLKRGNIKRNPIHRLGHIFCNAPINVNPTGGGECGQWVGI